MVGDRIAFSFYIGKAILVSTETLLNFIAGIEPHIAVVVAQLLENRSLPKAFSIMSLPKAFSISDISFFSSLFLYTHHCSEPVRHSVQQREGERLTEHVDIRG